MEEILRLCLSMEKEAEDLYRQISAQSESHTLKKFWQEMAEDERRHVRYWEELVALEAQRGLPNIFDHPEKTKAELQQLKLSVEGMLGGEGNLSDTSTSILLAYRLESLMLHPALPILFRALREHSGEQSPEDDYQKHIDRLARFSSQFLQQRPEIELIGEILSRMWKDSTELVDQFTQLRTLRGLIPICASCKKVRDDRGYWNQIESYLAQHSHATFSHGLCPQCARRLYPEYVRE